ncbi:MAG: hypothetical protein ACLGPL_03365, partial [Acidobacteriota bacterium]
MSAVHTLMVHYRRVRYASLFCSLLLTAVMAPMLAVMGARPAWVEVFLLLNFLAAAFSTSSTQ